MSTVGEVRHPTVKYKLIGNSYILVGVVELYTYIRWEAPNSNSVWSGCDNNHKRLIVSWGVVDATLHGTRYIDVNNPKQSEITGNDELCNFLVKVPLVDELVLKVLCKRNNCNLREPNPFLCDLICEHY